MYSFPNVKMHLAQGLKHSDGKSCLHSSLRPGSPEHHAPAEVGDAGRAGDGTAAVPRSSLAPLGTHGGARLVRQPGRPRAAYLELRLTACKRSGKPSQPPCFSY